MGNGPDSINRDGEVRLRAYIARQALVAPREHLRAVARLLGRLERAQDAHEHFELHRVESREHIAGDV